MAKHNVALDASFWINGYKIEFAARAYARGELNLSGAARHASIGVEEMMRGL
jgi:hypothetical protein